MSVGGVLLGSLSLSALLISALFVNDVPAKLASTFAMIFTVVFAFAAKAAIGMFNFAVLPVAVQFASFNVKPAGK